MARYGRDFYGGRPMGRGWGGAMRQDFGYGAQDRFEERGGSGYRGYHDEAWGGRRSRYDDGWGSTDRGQPGRGMRGQDGLPPGDWETGQPWGGTGDVDRVCAADIMTRNPEAVTPDTPLTDVAQRMRDLDVGIIPVVDSEDSFHLQGVITDRDITIRAAAEGKDMSKATAGEFMTSRVDTVGETDHIREVFTVMKRERVRRVPVTDDEGRLVGIIAQADLAVNYAGLDLQRETEVEEVIERISEPARPRWGRDDPTAAGPRRFVAGGRRQSYDRDLTDRLRQGWNSLRREARQVLGRGYDRGWW